MSNDKQTAKFLANKYKTKLGIDIGTLGDMCALNDVLLDTGSATLNAILSGSVKGGVPIGRMVGFYGPSGCGKSFLVGNLINDAVKKGFVPILIDAEDSWTPESAISFGFGIDDCIVMKEKTVETIRNNLNKILSDEKSELESGNLKFMIILDSLAALISQKEERDFLNDHNAMDMGTKARVIRTLLNSLTKPCGKYGIPFIWTNHIYENPAELYASAIAKMPGGKAPWFFSSIIVGMRRKEVKNEDGENKSSSHSGAAIPIKCVKQRFIQPFIGAEMYIDYSRGLNRYYGLFDLAKDLGVIVGNRSYDLVKVDGTTVKLGFRKNIEDNVEMWENVIIPELDPVIKREFSFGSKIGEPLSEEDASFINSLETESELQLETEDDE